MCTSRRCRVMATAWSSRTWRASSSPAMGFSILSPSTSPATWMAATTTTSTSSVAPWPPTGSPVAPSGSSALSGLRRRIAVRELFYFSGSFLNEKNSSAGKTAGARPAWLASSLSHRSAPRLKELRATAEICGEGRAFQGSLTHLLFLSSYGIWETSLGRWGSLGWRSTHSVTDEVERQRMAFWLLSDPKSSSSSPPWTWVRAQLRKGRHVASDKLSWNWGDSICLPWKEAVVGFLKGLYIY